MMAESQAKAYNLDLQHSEKVFSMYDTDDAEPAEVEEVLKVVTAAKLMTNVVTTAAPITTIAQVKSKDKGKGILIEEPKPLKRQAQIDMDEAFARQLEAKLNANINWNDVIEQVKRREKQDNAVMSDTRPIFEKHYNSIQAFQKKEEDEVTVQEKRQEPKNFSDDFLLNTLKIMFEKPNVEATVWRDQKSRYGLAKVKSWKLFESCRVHIITFTTAQMIFLVEKKYPLTHFTLQQMLDNVRLEVKEESEMALELLRLVKRQPNEGYAPE
nr:hypothetical protein [Tanacetum cinerariifolium]